jgi:hypothetical protein
VLTERMPGQTEDRVLLHCLTVEFEASAIVLAIDWKPTTQFLYFTLDVVDG